ncbi:hypothetical protein [Microbaculum marinum]|uniref:DUF3303 domain-containing protein n=1 Tax=Microbaculum marinum TaxID=1764581 RepID=A0AAW9RIW9_9HYPH
MKPPRTAASDGRSRSWSKPPVPKAAYFTMIDGERGGYVFFEETDQANLTKYNEPMFAALDAHIEIAPVLTLDDLKRGLPD